MSGVGDEEPVVHMLLFAPGLNQLVGGKLAVTEVFQNFALLLGLAKYLELTAAQILELGKVIVQRGDSPRARPVAGQLKLHFHGIHALAELYLKLAQGIGPIQLRFIPLLLRPNYFAGNDLKALPLALLETLATAKHGL